MQAGDEENQWLPQNLEAQDGHGAQIPRNTGWLIYVVDYVLAEHYSKPIWRLRLLATFNFVALSMFGSFFLAICLPEVHETYQVPGLNTLGVSMARIDYASGGINPPHTHPRATDIPPKNFGFCFIYSSHRVTAITIVGVPVVVAAISLFLSYFWLSSESTNWIIGLLAVNISLLGGAKVVYFVGGAIIVAYFALQNVTGR